MPKEVIAGTSGNPFQTVVFWGRGHDDHVQVGVTDPALEGEFTRESGLFADLDRRAINELIRVLRRARDQAFGKDE